MRLDVRLLKRNFTDPLDFPEVGLEVQRYSRHRKGGSEIAEIRAFGAPWAIWELVNWLRAPVEILDSRGTAVWWGYLAELTVGVGGMELGLSLDGMANKVKVQYSEQADGSPAEAKETDWAEDTDSISTYGTFELVGQLQNGTLELANAWRDQLLDELKYPIPVIRHSGTRAQGGRLGATLRCRGWWFSLAWETYQNSSILYEAQTSTQIETIAGGAQFITATDIQDASGVYTSVFRDGTEPILAIVEALMGAGVDGGGQYVAEITRERAFRMYEEPSTDDLYLLPDGRVADVWGNELLNHECPVAQWVVLRDVVPPTVVVSRLADPSRFFVERSEYTVRDGRLVLEPRGADSPWSATAISALAGGGSPFVGRYEGPHAGLFRFRNEDDDTWSVLFQASDTANVPFISAGARNFASNSKWLRLGYGDRAHAYLKAPAGDDTDPEEHTDLVVMPMLPYRAVNASYTAGYADGIIETTTGVTVTLPDAAGIAGRIYEIAHTGAGTTTVQGTGGDTIGGQASVNLQTWQALRVASNGSDWLWLSATAGGEAQGRTASESVTVADAPTLLIPGIPLSVSEMVTVADSPAADIPSFVAESVAVADTPAVVLAALGVTASEAVTVADDPKVPWSGPSGDARLKEDGDYRLLESGDYRLVE